MNLTDPHGLRTTATSGRCGAHAARARSSIRCRPRRSRIYYEVRIRLYDLIWRCLAPHLGDRLPGRALRARSAARSSAGRIPTPAGTSRSSSRRSAAGAARRRATGTARCSAASTATRSTARPRSRRRATACTSTGSRSNDGPGGEGEHRGGKGIVARVPRPRRTAASSPAPTRGTATRRGRSPAATTARRTTSW